VEIQSKMGKSCSASILNGRFVCNGLPVTTWQLTGQLSLKVASKCVLIRTISAIDQVNDFPLTTYRPESSNAISYWKFSTNVHATASSETHAFHGVNATHGIDATSAILLDNDQCLRGPCRTSIGTQPFADWRNDFHPDGFDQRICPSDQCIAQYDKLGDAAKCTSDSRCQQPDCFAHICRRSVLPSGASEACLEWRPVRRPNLM
jgi:hypothetical protein